MRWWLPLLGTILGCGPETADTGDLLTTRAMVRASRITTGNADGLLLAGDRADGDIGHYAITNGLLTAVIDDVGFHEDFGIARQHHRAPSGGTALDLAPVGARDSLRQIVHVINYDPDIRVYYQVVEIVEEGRALQAMGRILDPDRSLGVALDEDDLVEQIVVTTTWRAWDRQPWIEVETEVTNQTGRGVDLGPVCDLLVTDGDGLDAFVPSPGVGFELVEGDRVLAPWVAFAGNDSALGSLGVLSLDDQHVYVTSDEDRGGRVRGVMVGPYSAVKNTLAPGEQRSWTRRWTATPGKDLGGVTENVLALLSEQPGSFYVQLGMSDAVTVNLDVQPVQPTRAVFERIDPDRFLDQAGQLQDGGVMPMSTACSVGTDGTLSTALPPGVYQVTVDAAGSSGEAFEILVSAGLEQYESVTVGDNLHPLEVTLTRSGGVPNADPVRLTVVGLGGTQDPELGRFELAQGSLAAGRRVWTSASTVELSLPEGAYRLVASQGLEAALSVAELRVPDTEQLQLVLEEPEDMAAGWISVDPFSASAGSLFGSDTASNVASALCAEGIDLVVRAEAGGGESAVQGCESQQAVTGALGTLDVPRSGAAEGDGWYVAFPHHGHQLGPGMAPGSWLDLAWEAGAQVTVILAPRAPGAAGAASGLFHARAFERDAVNDGKLNRFLRETSEAGTRVTDATGVEVLSPRDPWRTDKVLADWYALLEGGYDLAPFGSSHAAWLARDNPGAARTMVFADGESTEERLAAMAEGRVYATSGPLLDVSVEGPRGSALPGQALDVLSGETIEVHVRLRAQDWVPVDRVRVLMGGQEVWSVELEADGSLEFTDSVPLLVADEAWLVVDAGRPSTAPEGDYARVYPDMPAYAVTAPIWLE